MRARHCRSRVRITQTKTSPAPAGGRHSMSNEAVTLSMNEVVVLRELNGGAPKRWGELRTAYFGPVRSRQQASTAFFTKINNMVEKELVEKTDGTSFGKSYRITAKGQASIQILIDAGKDLSAAKTNAQIEYEQKHPEETARIMGEIAAGIHTGKSNRKNTGAQLPDLKPKGVPQIGETAYDPNQAA